MSNFHTVGPSAPPEPSPTSTGEIVVPTGLRKPTQSNPDFDEPRTSQRRATPTPMRDSDWRGPSATGAASPATLQHTGSNKFLILGISGVAVIAVGFLAFRLFFGGTSENSVDPNKTDPPPIVNVPPKPRPLPTDQGKDRRDRLLKEINAFDGADLAVVLREKVEDVERQLTSMANGDNEDRQFSELHSAKMKDVRQNAGKERLKGLEFAAVQWPRNDKAAMDNALHEIDDLSSYWLKDVKPTPDAALAGLKALAKRVARRASHRFKTRSVITSCRRTSSSC